METAVDEVMNSGTVDDGCNEQANDHANDEGDDQDNVQGDVQGDYQTDSQYEVHAEEECDDDDNVRVDDLPDDNAKNHADDQTKDTEIKQSSKQQNTSSDDVSSQNSTNVITNQPKSSIKAPSPMPTSDSKDGEHDTIPSTAVNDIDVDVEGSSKLDYELAIVPGACLSASAGVGSASKELCNGFTDLECRYPNVGCELSCGCEDGLQLVSDCTMELCSANCILGCLACSLGLALDTKATWNQDGVEFEVLGTGIETSQGKVLRVLGSGIGIIDSEKRETVRMKRKAKEVQRAQKAAAKDKEKMVEKATELEMSGEDNTAAEIEE